ncbi:MAG: DNA-formamidopyrimidine glycosylase family protein, partial [Myxococcota bacterium]
MPEGPEIRRAADRIERVLVGRQAQSVVFGLPQLAPFIRRLEGRDVLAVDTVGKAMLTRFDGGLSVYSHSLLYGRWYVQRRRAPVRTRRQLRFGVYTETHAALLF